MKTFYYELNEDNRILWIDEVDRLNAIDPKITSPTIELKSIDDVMIWQQGIVDGNIVDMFVEPEDTFDTFAELQFIQDWLQQNDYKINKHALGEYSDTDERWTSYLEERKEKLLRYNELELLLEE